MAYLIYNYQTEKETVYELNQGINSIGRALDNSIIVPHRSLSRKHAEIEIDTDGVTLLRDLQSRNHTYVNEVEIEEYQLEDGDRVRCGQVKFQFLQNTGPNHQEKREGRATIFKQFSTRQTSTEMEELLDKDKSVEGSLLKLSERDSNQRVVDKLQILLLVSKQLSSPEKPDKLLNKILNLLFEIMNVDRAAILLVNARSRKLECRAVKSRSGVPTNHQFYSRKITNMVRDRGDAIITADACADDRFQDSQSILFQNIHASICVPLKPREEVIGVLYVDNLSMSNVYVDEDVEFLTALANQAAIAINHAELYQQMQAEAIVRDKLERFFPTAVSQKIREEGKISEIVDTEVTALFSDITGFTKMSSCMEPRQVIELLNEYFQVIVEEIVFPYEGTLEKYIGDALLAVWGAPYQKPDDAQRAVQAAIEMQWAVRQMNRHRADNNKQPLYIHIGLNTGKVAAGNIGSKKLIQYATIGDTINVASRICSAAKSGDILIGQSTLDKIDTQNIPLEKLEPVQVKGKEYPLQLYRVLWKLVQSLDQTIHP